MANPMLSAPHFRSTLSLILALLFVPHTSWAEVDTAVVAKILGEELSLSPEIDDEKSKKMLDTMSNSAAKLLDQNNKDWNASSPKWKTVYDRVHADLESEMPSILAAGKSQAQELLRACEADIASHLSQSDVDAILAYYGTPEGQRYQEFIRRVDKIMNLGAASFTNLGNERPAATKLTPEQTKQYVRMLMLSRLFQSILASSQIAKSPVQDTSGYGDYLGFAMGLAANKSQDELEALDKEYAGDLTGFEAFTKTDAAQHLFAAMGQAMLRTAKINPLADSFKAVFQKHESEWKALYLAQ